MHLQFLKTLPSNFDGVSIIFSSRSQIVHKIVNFTTYVPQNNPLDKWTAVLTNLHKQFCREAHICPFTVRQNRAFENVFREFFVSTTSNLTRRAPVWQFYRKRVDESPKKHHPQSEINSKIACFIKKLFFVKMIPWTLRME